MSSAKLDSSENNHLFLGYSLADFIRTFPEIAHVKEVKNGTYVLTNKNNLKLFGFIKDSDLIGKNVFDLADIMRDKWPTRYADNIQAYDDKVIETHKPLFAKPDEFLNQDGFVVIHSFMKIPLFDFSKKLKAILTLVFDSTKQEDLKFLRKVYAKLYGHKKTEVSKFLQFAGIDPKYAKLITNRELDCILSLIKHKTLKEVAADLNISIKTVEVHFSQIRKILHCYTTAELVNMFNSKFSYKI